MSSIHVRGLRSLQGEVKIQGSKNAVLPMMAAAVLHKGTTVITNVPVIQDVSCMMGILEVLGCSCTLQGHQLTIDASGLDKTEIPEEYVSSMRSSIMVLGALLGRKKSAVTSYPGGCSIGKRPVDLHFLALEKLGAVIREEEGAIFADCIRLQGTEIELSYPSVGATENVILAGVLADGNTVIRGAAKEPEIEELCLFLNNMGAKISGIGTSVLRIEGVLELCDSEWNVSGDRIVAGTYMAAVLAAGGSAVLKGIVPAYMDSTLQCVRDMGAQLVVGDDWLRIQMDTRANPVAIKTGPYPEFPTDLQSVMLSVMAVGDGRGEIEETVFEGRFGAAKELQKLGADIIIEEKKMYIQGTYPLHGQKVKAMDLRGGAALVVGGLAAQGLTIIEDCRHISRGYEDICLDLTALGAAIVSYDERI